MSGLQHLPKLQNGKFLISLTFLLVICGFLVGCANLVAPLIPGPGRADWDIQLSDEYYIIRANSNSKNICKATETDGLYENVLSCFYITKYYVYESYIFLEGIPTAEIIASDYEKESDERCYYVLDVIEEQLWGPYDTENALLESDIIKEGEMLAVEWEILPN